MMGQRLFAKRLSQEWKKKLGVARSVIDGWILLYFVIPAAVLLPILYHEDGKRLIITGALSFPSPLCCF
ncbi:hypothetical protein [Sporolactobacillus laevolacticus]|uniref:Uncharacterized protein n=1 Tax=Sporolactobacillus laevolacticus DSM 442 TaxID=1395513 RepID=V6J1F8_9BACL|nr:hypothetical protein [Sporolactobacillus laevolacticus]EST13650.1 hypothetical protein P343_00320 [Sporolactobacillus laevolacticus DSM 442]